MRFAALAIGVLFSSYVFGQTGGTITGVISDPSGAVVANASIEAKNTDTGVVSTVATSATGNYEFGGLPAGTYEIDVNITGFKKSVRTGVTVQQLQTTRVDFALQVGSATDAVTVVDVAPLLQTESGDVSHNVTTQLQDDLPMGAIGTVHNSTEVVLNDSRRERWPHQHEYQWHAGRQRTDPGSTAWTQPTPWATPTTRSVAPSSGFAPGGRGTNQ